MSKRTKYSRLQRNPFVLLKALSANVDSLGSVFTSEAKKKKKKMLLDVNFLFTDLLYKSNITPAISKQVKSNLTG